jgi:hypothetical protein
MPWLVEVEPRRKPDDGMAEAAGRAHLTQRSRGSVPRGGLVVARRRRDDGRAQRAPVQGREAFPNRLARRWKNRPAPRRATRPRSTRGDPSRHDGNGNEHRPAPSRDSTMSLLYDPGGMDNPATTTKGSTTRRASIHSGSGCSGWTSSGTSTPRALSLFEHAPDSVPSEAGRQIPPRRRSSS